MEIFLPKLHIMLIYAIMPYIMELLPVLYNTVFSKLYSIKLKVNTKVNKIYNELFYIVMDVMVSLTAGMCYSHCLLFRPVASRTWFDVPRMVSTCTKSISNIMAGN